jgi:valacyclovir hydrolase
VLGWSDGAKSALIMAIRYPARIKSCIIWGIVTYATEKDIKAVLVTRNIKYWGSDMIDNYYKVYGKEWQTIWNKHMDFLENIIDVFPEGFCKKDLSKCRCPVMILHGDLDPIVDIQHANYVLKSVSDARLHRFPNGSHNLHCTNPLEFKKLVEDFLDECDEGF